MGMHSCTYIGPVVTIKLGTQKAKQLLYGCKHCDTDVPTTNTYCSKCGTPLEAWEKDVVVNQLPDDFYDKLDLFDWWGKHLESQEDNTYHLLMNYGVNQSDYLLDLDADIEEFIQPLPKPYPIEKFKESMLYNYLINLAISIDFTPQAVVRYWS